MIVFVTSRRNLIRNSSKDAFRVWEKVANVKFEQQKDYTDEVDISLGKK